MKILIACIHYPSASGRFIARAFRRLGHDVRPTGPSTGAGIWGIEVDPRWIWTPDFDPAMDSWQLDGADWNPDLMITADSGYIFDWVPRKPTPHILWGVDNHVRDYQGRIYDAMFFAHNWGYRIGEPNTHWLPPAYDPETHVDFHRERDIPVGMMAVPYHSRQAMADRFAQMGLPLVAGVGMLWDDYRDWYNRVKVAVLKSVMGDLTQRFFECMAMGCAVLCDHPKDAEALGFRAYIDYLPYYDDDDAVEKARRLLENGRWVEFALRGQKTVRPHTWDARALELLRTVDKIKLAPGLATC